MKYRNTKTGALIETACPVSGADWVEVKAAKPASKAPGKNAPKSKNGKE